MSEKHVLILMGSDSDLVAMEEVGKALATFQVEFEMHIASAHRTPDKVSSLAREARDRGFGVIVAGAGLAAHLAGVAAAHTTLPVIAVPLATGALNGVDALLSVVQMPRGIPVGTVAIGSTGAYNAGLLAASILSVSNPALADRLDRYRQDMARTVEEKDAALQRRN
jgi:5-(carboxyamino)imidazole ribonucleotide mutase